MAVLPMQIKTLKSFMSRNDMKMCIFCIPFWALFLSVIFIMKATQCPLLVVHHFFFCFFVYLFAFIGQQRSVTADDNRARLVIFRSSTTTPWIWLSHKSKAQTKRNRTKYVSTFEQGFDVYRRSRQPHLYIDQY